jgi:hypothetical protein
MDGIYLALGIGLAIVGLVNAAAIALGSWSLPQERRVSVMTEGAVP